LNFNPAASSIFADTEKYPANEATAIHEIMHALGLVLKVSRKCWMRS